MFKLLYQTGPKTFDFFWFWAPVTEEERKRLRSKRRLINAEERRRRKNWKRERVDRVFIRKENEYWGEIVIKIRIFVS